MGVGLGASLPWLFHGCMLLLLRVSTLILLLSQHGGSAFLLFPSLGRQKVHTTPLPAVSFAYVIVHLRTLLVVKTDIFLLFLVSGESFRLSYE